MLIVTCSYSLEIKSEGIDMNLELRNVFYVVVKKELLQKIVIN